MKWLPTGKSIDSYWKSLWNHKIGLDKLNFWLVFWWISNWTVLSQQVIVFRHYKCQMKPLHVMITLVLFSRSISDQLYEHLHWWSSSVPWPLNPNHSQSRQRTVCIGSLQCRFPNSILNALDFFFFINFYWKQQASLNIISTCTFFFFMAV